MAGTEGRRDIIRIYKTLINDQSIIESIHLLHGQLQGHSFRLTRLDYVGFGKGTQHRAGFLNLAQYAIRGYEVSALDYVLKPVSYHALSMKLHLALRLLQRNLEYSLLLNRGKDLQRVPVSHLHYVEVYSHQFHYHTAEGNMWRRTMKT